MTNVDTIRTTGTAEHAPLAEVSAADFEGSRAGYQEGEERPASREEADSQQGSDEDDNESSTQSESAWLFRAQYKTDELRKLFNLPESEVRMQQQLALLTKTCTAWMY